MLAGHARAPPLVHAVQGFAAVKLTALGNPLLLKRVSTAVREVQALFAQWDADGNQVRRCAHGVRRRGKDAGGVLAARVVGGLRAVRACPRNRGRPRSSCLCACWLCACWLLAICALQVVDRKEFTEAYSLMLPDATAEEQRRVFEWLDQQVRRAALNSSAGASCSVPSGSASRCDARRG